MPARPLRDRVFWLQAVCILFGIAGVVSYAASKFTPGRAIAVVTVVAILGFMVTLVILARWQKRPGPIARTVALSLLAVILGAYAILFPLVYFFQDAIANQTNAFFQPKALSAEAALALSGPGIEAVDVTAPDGTRLRGWLVRNATAQRTPLLIYFTGSGTEASTLIPFARKLSGWSVALVNYRGFGQSDGTPSHAHALDDATLLYDAFSQRDDIDAGRIVAMGHSLGTGSAVYLAALRPVFGTVLVSPADRWTLTGVDRPLLYAPLSAIMKPYFDSVTRAPGIRTPMLCLIGANDTTISPERSRNLAGQWGGATVVKTYPGEGHDLLVHDNSSWADILAFLEGTGP